jgi:threonine aldolase
MASAIAKEDLIGLGGNEDLPARNGTHTKQNAWSGPGPAAFDFRSTSPTLFSMAYANAL